MAREHVSYPFGEELANSISHGIGVLLSIAGLVLMVVYSSMHGSAWHVVSTAVFGSSLILLYSASTLYHSFRGPRVRHIFRVLDHSSIFVLIAGSYTPFTLVSLRGPWGWTLFGIVWGLAILGIVIKSIAVGRLNVVSTIVYLLMGWLVVIAARPMIASVPWNGLMWLALGGLFYSGGTIFYLWKRLPYSHAIWHMFVLGGSVAHFFAVFLYVIP